MQAKKTTTTYRTEIKLLTTIVFGCLFGLYIVTASSLVARIVPDFRRDTSTNFICESKGIQEGRGCSKEDYGSYAIAGAIGYAWISNGAAHNIVFVLSIDYIKKKLCSK